MRALIMAVLVIGCTTGAGAAAPSDEAALLRQATTEYLDRLLELRNEGVAVPRPNRLKIGDRFGFDAARTELLRQLKERKSDYLYGQLLFVFEDERSDEVRDIALAGIESEIERYRRRSMLWCAKHPDLVQDDHRAKIRSSIKSVLQETNAQSVEDLWIIASVGTKADIPWLRKIYQQHFFQREPDYTCTNLTGVNKVTRSGFLLALAKMGDEAARIEIAQAISQEKNIQQRAWGLVMAALLTDKSLVPLVGKALDDKRQVPEPIEQWQDPDAKGPRLLRTSYHRVCDVAVRAVRTIDVPKGDWMIKAPPLDGSWRFLHGESNEVFDHVQPLNKEADPKRGLFLNHVILGYTDEQLEQVRGYMKTRAAEPNAKGK